MMAGVMNREDEQQRWTQPAPRCGLKGILDQMRDLKSSLENRESHSIRSSHGCKVAARVNGDVMCTRHLSTAAQKQTREEELAEERLFHLLTILPIRTSS